MTIAAGPPPPAHLEPQALQIAQKETLEQLTALTRHKGAVGVEAAKVLVLMKHHIAQEQAFILPPLTLLPYLADNKVTADMAAWALPMIDRVKAEREEIFAEHTQITDALSALVAAAIAAHDKAALARAERRAGRHQCRGVRLAGGRAGADVPAGDGPAAGAVAGPRAAPARIWRDHHFIRSYFQAGFTSRGS